MRVAGTTARVTLTSHQMGTFFASEIKRRVGKEYVDPVPEHRFHPVRKWQFDWAWPELRLAVEFEGGGFVAGRHVRGRAYALDCEKYNAASAGHAWLVLRFTYAMIQRDLDGCVHVVADAYVRRKCSRDAHAVTEDPAVAPARGR